VRVALAGQPQRHFYLARVARLVRELRPDLAFLEQEPFSVPGLQWGAALGRAGIPYGLQADENLDRPFPWPARVIRRLLLPRARWIAARSPTAERVALGWGARGRTGVVPHTVPEWESVRRGGDPVFTVGFAGRLVPEKGILELVEAVSRLPSEVRLLVVGNGSLRAEVEATTLPNGRIEVRAGVAHEQMRAVYGEMDVLAVPSRTTSTWAEQYGRVLVEAMLCGRPVVGYRSGEIPWVIESTGGGMLVPEGDVGALAEALRALQANPRRRQELAERGRAEAVRLFSVDAVADALERLLLDGHAEGSARA